MTSSTPGSTTALSAAGFVDSIGVNVHMAYTWTTYGNVGMVESSLAYLGVENIRDAFVPWSQVQPAYTALADLGYKFDFLIPPASVDIPGFVAEVDAFVQAHPGSVLAVEGPNEVNLWPVTYNGGSALSNAAQYEQALYSAIRADANLNGIPVYNLTLGTSDSTVFSQLGNLSASANDANSHAYLHADRAPILSLNQLLPLAQMDAPGLPTVITETGYSTDPYLAYNGVDQVVQAKYTLDTLMDAYKGGVAQTFLYELLDQAPDPGNTDPEMHYGLFNADGTPKLAATAIHDLTTILNDPGATSSFTPGSLSYTISNLTPSYTSYGANMLLEKSNGTFDLVIWGEPAIWDPTTQQEIASPHATVAVSFGQVEGLVQVFDPLLGTTAIATYSNVQQIQVDITDHPLVVEINGVLTTVSAPLPAAPAAPVIASFSPDSNIVGDGITNANHLTLNGTALAGTTINVFDGTTALGTTTVNASGSWSFATGQLADGSHAFTTTDSNTSGQLSSASTALNVTVDTHAPSPLLTGLTQNWNGGVTLSGTSEANSTVSIYDGAKAIGTVTASANGTFSFTSGSLSNTVHTFSTTATDLAGNTGTGQGVAIEGTNGNNTLTSSTGNDLLFGGKSSDTFVFGTNFGRDTVLDFQASGGSHDVLQFSHNTFSSFSAVLAHAAQVGSDVVITADAADAVTLHNVQLAALQKSDIHIV